MPSQTVFDIYCLITEAQEGSASRKRGLDLRKRGFNIGQEGFVKQAFDTRRIDQETEYNPRRGLQNYNRSEAFLSEAMGEKVKNFAKLRKVLADLKVEYGKEHEWQDSNARVLLSTLDKGLRVNEQDGDFSEAQPAMGSLDYIEELMHVRYRLGFDDLTKLGETELRKIILSKDEELIRKDVGKAMEITKSDVVKHGYDALLDKLFDGCRASAENPDVERTITITIRDRLPTKRG